jgi:hypothetical protein
MNFSRHAPARRGLLAAVFLSASVTSAVAGGPNLIHTEDFRSTAMRDEAVTTAVWNTSAGVLSLTPFSPTTVGAARDVGRAFDVAVYGRFACVASLDAGLVIVDLANPADPRPVAAVELGGEPRGVSVAGSLAAVATRAGGVVFVDLSRPAQPVVRGEFRADDDVMGVALVGRFAYLAAQGAGLVILDVADPAAPVLVGHANVVDRALNVVVDGDHAYVADYHAGVAVFDINTPASPVRVGQIATSGDATALALSGDLLAVAIGAAGVELFDVTQPTAVTRAGTVPTPGAATDVAFQQRLLMTTTSTARLLMHDLTDPALPVAKWTRELVGPGRGVALYGELGLVALDEAGVDVVQLEEPAAAPIALTGYYGTDMHNPRDIATAGQVAYVATEPEGLLVVSLPYRGQPTRLAAMPTPGNAVAVAVSGNLVCVADSLSGLRTFDVTAPSAPVALGGYDTPGQALDVAITNNVACVADGTGGLRLISIANPNAPALISTCALPGAANAVAVWGTLAVVTDGSLRLVNIANPAAPVLVGSCTGLGGAARGVAMQGNIAWVTAGADGLYAIDVSNPASPVVLSVTTTDPAYYAYRTPAVWGRRVVALEASAITYTYVRILDGGDPAAPSLLLRWYTNETQVNAIALDGDRLLSLTGSPGLNTIGGLTSRALAQPDVSGALSGIGQSLNVVPDLPHIVCARLTAQQGEGVTWRMYTSASAQSVGADGTWLDVDRAGYGLRWRASLSWKYGNPTVDGVQVEWRLREARIDSIVDVRGDQGGWANLHFTGSGYDLRHGTISGYNVYRRVDDAALAAKVRAAAAAEVEVDGVTYVVNDADAKVGSPAKSVPPGVWSVVASFFPTRQDHYIVTVPTARDVGPGEAGWSSYYVAAWHSSTGTWFHSLPDSGRSVDNLAPGVPNGLTAAYAAGGVTLQWQPAPERDFQYHRVYRGTWPGFTPTPDNLVGATAAATWTDATPAPWPYSYKVTSVDHAGNESAAAAPAAASDVGDTTVPAAFALRGSEPNPFNAGTTVRWEVPAGGARVELAIFDARGCRVRTLIEGALPAGRHSLRWDGRDDAGRTLATGTYFCRLAADGRTVRAIKMSLVQ